MVALTGSIVNCMLCVRLRCIWFVASNSETLLDVVNIVLGATVVILVVVILGFAGRELIQVLRRGTRRPPNALPGSLAEMLSKLGITMHDGGQTIEDRDEKKGNSAD